MRAALRTLSMLCVALGLILGASWVTADQRATRETFEAQKVLRAQVPISQNLRTASPVQPGNAFVTLRIPRFGSDWRWVALEGTASDVIARGPGHYTGTVLPGERGNSAFAAHRAGHGDPFIDFDLLVPGDHIYISQKNVTWTYTVTTRPEIIEVSDDWVLNPLPGKILTLTTCWPKYGSSKRMYIRAELIKTEIRKK